MSEIIETAGKTIEKHCLLEKGDSVLIALSGGSDSVFLLRMLLLLEKDYEIALKAAHLNHMLRGEQSKRDAEWVKRLCRECSVECIAESRDVSSYARREGLSLEEAARVCRYDFLERVRLNLNADKIALGHTMNDQAETFLLQLMRGSGMTGLSAMAPKRGHLIRPLLELERDGIRAYLDREGISYLNDPSNLDLRFGRNIIRHRIIPSIESSTDRSLVPILARTASLLSEEDALLDDIARRDLAKVSRKEGPNLELDIDSILQMGIARRRRLIRIAIQSVKGDLRNIGSAHVEKLIEVLESGSPGSKVDIPSLEAYRDYKTLLLGRGLLSSVPEYEKAVNIPGLTVVNEASLSISSSLGNPTDAEFNPAEKTRAYFDYDQLSPPLLVRNRRRGDRFVPFAQTGLKKLKEVMIDDRMPRRLRQETPIIVDGEGILWIPGGRRSNRALVTSKTERVLCIEARKSTD